MGLFDDDAGLSVELGLNEVRGTLSLSGVVPGQRIGNGARLVASGGLLLAAIASPLVWGAIVQDRLSPGMSAAVVGVLGTASVLGLLLVAVRLLLPRPHPYVATPHRLRIGPWAAEAAEIRHVGTEHWTTRDKRGKPIEHHVLEVVLDHGAERFTVGCRDGDQLDALADLVRRILRDEPPAELPPELVRLLSSAQRS